MADRAARSPRTRLRAHAALAGLAFAGAVPLAAQEQPPPTPGERIRIDVLSQTAYSMGLETPWEGTFIMAREDALVVSNIYNGGVALPLTAVQTLRVRRPRPPSYAFVRGGIAGAAFGVGMWRFLKVLCRKGCTGGMGSAWFPAVASGLGVGLLVSGQGPGTHWVQTAMPVPEPATGLSISVPLPTRNR